MKFIKVAILIFVFSTNLMLGQKAEIPKDKRCVSKESFELRFLNPQPTFSQKITENCSEAEFKTGAFFQFAAL